MWGSWGEQIEIHIPLLDLWRSGRAQTSILKRHKKESRCSGVKDIYSGGPEKSSLPRMDSWKTKGRNQLKSTVISAINCTYRVRTQGSAILG